MMDRKLVSAPMLVITVSLIMILLSSFFPHYQLFSATEAQNLDTSTAENGTSSNLASIQTETGSELIDASFQPTSTSDPISTGPQSEPVPISSSDDYPGQAEITGSPVGQGVQSTNNNNEMNSTNSGSGVATGGGAGTDPIGTDIDTSNESPQTSETESSGGGTDGSSTGGSSSNSTVSSGDTISTPVSNETSSSSSSSNPSTSNQSSIPGTVSESGDTVTTGDGDSSLDTIESTGKTTGSVETLAGEQSFEVASASNPNTVEHTISSGDDNKVNIGSISNIENVTATLALDKESYKAGDSPVVTVNDGEANVDPDAVNTIQINLNSSSDATGISVTLTETGTNTGVFQGAFSFTNGDSSSSEGKIKVATGDELGISYIGTHPRFDAEISGVQQGGTVSLTQVARPAVENPPFILGAAVELTYGAEVQLIPNDFIFPNSGDVCPAELCSGTINLAISYANVPLCIDDECQNPEALTVWQYLGPDIGWQDLRDFQPPGTSISVDTDAKTVSAFSPFTGGIFSLGITGGGSGGGSGGLGLAGAGIVLDLVAPIVAEEVPPSETPSGTTTDTESDTDNDVENSPAALSSVSEETNETNTSPLTQSTGGVNTGGSSQQSGARSAEDGVSMNTTIVVPGIGNVTLSSSNLGLERNFEVTALKAPQLADLNVTKSSVGSTMTVSTQNGTRYDVVGSVLEIGPSDLEVNGTLTVSIPYNSTLVLNGGSGEIVRLIYYSGSSWEDVTVAPFADGKLVTGSLTDIGPVVAAVKAK